MRFCQGVGPGWLPAFTHSGPKASEVKAANAEIDCLRSKLEKCGCKGLRPYHPKPDARRSKVFVIGTKMCIRLLFIPTLIAAVCSISGQGKSQQDGVEVTLSTQKPLTLHVTVHSHAQSRVTLSAYALPWGTRNSMMLLPVDSDRQCFDNTSFVPDDSGFEKVSIEANGSVSGEVDLRTVLPSLEDELKK